MIRSISFVLRSLVGVSLGALALSGCTPKTEGGLLLKVTVASGLRADCLVIDGSTDGARITRSVVTRQASRNEYYVGVVRRDLPAALDWQVSAVQGRCGDETDWKLSSRSDVVSKAFPATGIETVDIAVGLPDATLDQDRDSYVDRNKGGADCDDSNPQVNPGAEQVCNSATDTDCNGRVFCDDSACSTEVACTRPAVGLQFETNLQTLVAFDCSGPVAVQSIAMGMPAPVNADTVVSFATSGSAGAGVEFFSDTACQTRVTMPSTTIRFGTSRATFSFRATRGGALSVTASAPRLGNSTLNTTVTDRPVQKLRVSPATLAVRAGDCSPAIEVTALDDRMMPTPVPMNGLPLPITYDPPGTTSVQRYVDAACMTAVDPSIAPGATSTRFYVAASRVTAPQMPLQVLVSSPSVNSGTPESIALTVTSGQAAGIEFTSSVIGILNNVCGQAPAELVVVDASGNPTTAGSGGLVVTLAIMAQATNGTLSLSTAADCSANTTSFTINEGTSRTSLYLRANMVDTYRVTASAAALANPTANVQVDVATMNPTALVFSNSAASAATVSAGGCSPGIRLQTRETNSLTSPVSPVPSTVVVTLDPTPAGSVSLFRDPSCAAGQRITNNQLTLNPGQSEVTFYVSGTRAGDFSVRAQAPVGSGLSDSVPAQNGRIVPGTTTRMVFQPPTSQSAIAGNCAGPFSLIAQDAFMNPTFANGTIVPAASPPIATGALFSVSNACASPTASPTLTVADGGVAFFARAESARQYSITVTGLAASVSPATLTVDAGVPSALLVVTQPPANAGSGVCSAVEIERTDAFGNPSFTAAAQAYSVAVNTAGIATVHSDPGCSSAGALTFAANATRTTFYVRAVLTGSTTFTASGIGSVTTTAMNVTAAMATQIRFQASTPPATSMVGTCATATLERLDAQGNLTTLGPNAVTLTASGAASMNGLRLTSGSSCSATQTTSASLSFGSANAVTFAYEPRATGAMTFTASGTGLGMATGNTSVGAGGVSALRYISPPSGNVAYGSCVALEVEALDVGQNRVTSPTPITFAATTSGQFFTMSNCTGAMSTMATVPAGGTVTVGFRPLALGASTLTASTTGATNATANVTVIAGMESALTFSPTFMTNTTAGTCVNFTARRVDSGGNDAVGGVRAVTVALSDVASVGPNEALRYTGHGCTGGMELAGATVDIPNGGSTVNFSVRVRKVGALTLTVTSSGLTPPATTSTTVVAGNLASMTFSTTPPGGGLTANVCSAAVTVNGFDGEGNPAALNTQSLSMPNGSFFSTAGCTGGIANLAAGTATTATFYLRNSTAGTPTLQVGSTINVTQMWTINAAVPTTLRFKAPAPAASLARFSCAGPFRVELTDGTSVVATAGMRTVTLTGVGAQYFSDATCNTSITSLPIAAAGTETADFYFVLLDSGTVSLSEQSPALASANAMINSTGTPGACSLTVVADGPDVEYRGCVGVTVTRQVNGAPLSTGAFTTNVTLTTMGGGASGVTYHSANDCSGGTVSSVTLTAGQSDTKVYVYGHSAAQANATTVASATLGAADVISTDGFGAGSTNVNVHPAVRHGTCQIDGGVNSVTCTIQPPLPPTTNVRNRTFFTFQSTPLAELAGADGQFVGCWLNTGASALECERAAAVSAAAPITFDVLSFGSGVSVQHLEQTITTAASGSVVLAPMTAVPRANTFILTSHRTASGGIDWDDFPSIVLDGGTSTTNYEGGGIRLNGMEQFQATRMAIQIVTWSGLNVTSGVVPSSGGTSYAAAGVPAAAGGTTSALLYTAQAETDPGSEAQAICRYKIRGRLNAGVPTFTRGAGNMGNCTNPNIFETPWFRLEFPSAVASVAAPSDNIQIASGNANALWQVPRAIATHRMWAFVGGQGPSGQSSGETNRGQSNNNNYLAYTQAYLDFESIPDGGTGVRLQRGDDGGTVSRFTPYLVELAQ